MSENILIGKTIVRVELMERGYAIRFTTAEGEAVTAHCEGDCCSETWIENIEGAADILNRPILKAEDIDMPDLEKEDKSGGCIQYYGFRLTTDRGECTIDYRNESNGYYGGSLAWPGDFGHSAHEEKGWSVVAEQPVKEIE